MILFSARRSLALLMVMLVVVCVCLGGGRQASAQQQPLQQTPDEAPAPARHSIFEALLSPLRATLEHAKRMLGQHRVVDEVESLIQDGFDALQTQTFKVFMRLYNKTYSPAELPKRMALFFERRQFIEDSVRAFSEGRLPFVMRENQFVDWDRDELGALARASPPLSDHELSPEEQAALKWRRLSGAQEQAWLSELKNGTLNQAGQAPNEADGDEEMTIELYEEPVVRATLGSSSSGSDRDSHSLGERNLSVRAPMRIPTSKDWRQSGCVASPLNQQKCGCCYAVASMGVLETMRCINRVSSPILSSQQVIDCSTPRAGYQNHGCNGGWPTRVLRYLQDVRVAARETCYPFVRRQESCKLTKVKSVQGCSVQASISETSLKFKVLDNERDILYHVAKTGPVITVMRATDRFLYYGSGIFDDPSCSRKPDDVDHAIAIVGYGRENGNDYWIIKNSWGKDWGQDGYGKYKRGTNACSIGHWGWVVLS